MEHKPLKLTPAQEKAVRSQDKTVCVVAGAGTGKTLVLVERYIGLLREGLARIPNIVAITFTEKAAKEMKDRIRESCLKELQEASDAETRRFWLQHRNDLDNARICTIHSLCAQIIRESPVEAVVDPRFSVLDEVETDVLLKKVAKQALMGLIEKGDGNAVKLVAEYEFPKALALLIFVVDRRNLLETCLAGWDLGDEATAFRRWEEALEARRISAGRQTLSNPVWQEAVATIRETKPRTPGDKMDERRTNILKLLARIEQGPPKASFQILSSLRAECDLRGGSESRWATGDLARIKEAVSCLKSILEETPILSLGPVGEAERDMLGMTRALVNVSRGVIAEYAQHKRESAFLDFQDLEGIARDLLLSNAEVRERYRSRIRYVLVDEFQDTNETQKDIIYALSGGEKGDRLFIVGDAKQSIYRFRGADVSVFVAVQRAVEAANGELVPLEDNFRSLPSLVEFSNHFFGELMPRASQAGRAESATADYEASYSPLDPRRQTRSAPPQIELILMTRGEGDNADTLRRREAELMARRIRLMVDQKEPLVHFPDESGVERTRPVRFGDIAVLFRAMTRIWIYEQFLREYSIPYYVVAGSGFYARQEVRDVLNLVRVLDNRTDDLSLAGVLRSPMFAVSDNTLYWLGARRTVPLFERLLAHASIKKIEPAEREKLTHASKVLQELLDARDRVSLPELLTRALEMTRYDAVLLSQFLGKQKALNVYKLVELARKFDRRGIFTLHDFADYVSEFVASDVREGEAPVTEEASDVVTLMTIHKAKGLEFPVVFVTDVSRKEQPKGQDVYFDKEWGAALRSADNEEGRGAKRAAPVVIMAEEEKRKEEAESKRIFYVATTRAKDYLVFSGWQADQQAAAKDQPGPWFSWLNETFKLTEAGDEVAYKGGKLRVLRDVPYAPGMASGRHKSWAEKFPNELASLRPLPTKAAASEGDLAQRTAHIAHSLATKLRFTPTELQEYHWCHRAYYLRYVLGLPARAVRSERIQGAHAHARLRGRLAHRALQMSAGRPGVPLEDLLAEIVREEVVTDPTGLARSVTSDRILREVAEMLARFRETPTYQEISRAKESYCEFPFLVQFGPSPAVAGASAREGGKDFYLEGQMDLLYMGKEGWEVLDYKTGEANLSYEIQLGAYCLAVERLFGEKPAGVAIFFLESDKLSRVTTTPEYLAGAQTQITGLVEAIRAGRFNPVSMEKCQCEYEWACRR